MKQSMVKHHLLLSGLTLMTPQHFFSYRGCITKDGDTLVVDRAGVREFMAGVSSWPGIIGSITCDDFVIVVHSALLLYNTMTAATSQLVRTT